MSAIVRRINSCACFVAGTLVAMSSPQIDFAPIEDVRVGDRVQALSTNDGRTAIDESWQVAQLEMPLEDGTVIFIECSARYCGSREQARPRDRRSGWSSPSSG